MKQVDLVEILRSRETYDKDHPTISIYDALEAMKEACNQAIDLCAENAKLNHNYYDKDEERALYNEHKDFGFERCDGDGIPYGVDVVELNKESILNTKKQII